MLDANRLGLRPQNIRGILQEQPAALEFLGVAPHPRKTENSDGDEGWQGYDQKAAIPLVSD